MEYEYISVLNITVLKQMICFLPPNVVNVIYNIICNYLYTPIIHPTLKKLSMILPNDLACIVFDYACNNQRACFSNGFGNIIVYSVCGTQHCTDMLINCDICSNHFLKTSSIVGIWEGQLRSGIIEIQKFKFLYDLWNLLEDTVENGCWRWDFLKNSS
jgi:hypothetical protein